jgi:hypothetical protein
MNLNIQRHPDSRQLHPHVTRLRIMKFLLVAVDGCQLSRTTPNVPKPSEDGKRKPVHWLYEAAEWSAEEVRLLAAVRLQLKVAA